MRNHPARLVTALAGIVLMLPLSACIVETGRGEQSRSLNADVECPVEVDESVTATIRIAFQHIPNGDLIVRDAELLDRCLPNATIRWTQFSSGADVVRAFGAGSIDIGLFGSAPAARSLSAPLDLDVSIVWIHDVIGGAESLIVNDPGITSIQDLAGRSVGVPFGSTTHLSLMSALADAGITAEVNVINLEPNAIVGAWQGQQIDAAWIWEPTLSELGADDGGDIIMTAEDTAEAGSPTFDLAAARTAFVDQNPAVMTMWTAAQNWAVELIQNDPDAAVTRIAGQLGLDIETVQRQLDGYVYLTAAEQAEDQWFGGGLGTALLDTATFLNGQGEVDAVGDPDHYNRAVYDTAIREVAGQ